MASFSPGCRGGRGSRPTGPRWIHWPFSLIWQYREYAIRYWFPDPQDLDALLAPFFSVVASTNGSYEMAQLCPILLLEPASEPAT